MRLLGHGIIKPDSRSPSTTASSSDAQQRTELEIKRVIIEICCGEDSLPGRVDGPYGSDCHVTRITEKMDLNSYKTRRDLLDVSKTGGTHSCSDQPSLHWWIDMDICESDHSSECPKGL